MKKLIPLLSYFLLCTYPFLASPGFADGGFGAYPAVAHISTVESDVLLSQAFATRIAELGAATHAFTLRLARVSSLDLADVAYVSFDIELKSPRKPWVQYGRLAATVSVDSSGAATVEDFAFAPSLSNDEQSPRGVPAPTEIITLPYDVSLMLVQKDFTDLVAQVAATKTQPGRLKIVSLREENLSGHPFAYAELSAIQESGSAEIPVGED